MDELTRRAEEKKDSLDEIFSESDQELSKMLDNFDQEMEGLRNELQSIQSTIDKGNIEISSMRAKQDNLNRQHGEVILLERQLEDNINSTFESMVSFSRTYSITSIPTSSFRSG